MAKDGGIPIRRTLCRRCAALGIPAQGFFELTPRCNLQCRMCYVRLTPEQMAPIGRELTAEEWLAVAQKARDMGMVFLLLTGGEPTLRDDFAQIYEGLVQMGLSISINTNGTLLTPALRALWHRLPPAQVNITLYGTCREDYAALCGNPAAFDAVVDALRWLKAEGILVHLNTTIAPTNYDRWEEIEAFAREWGFELRMTAYCFPPVRREEGSPCECFERLAPELAGELIVRDMLYREGIEGVKRRAADLDQPVQKSCNLDNGEPMQCLAGRSQFWMTWDGRMTPCAMTNRPEFRVPELGFEGAWEKLREAVAAIRLCPDCVACKEQHTCLNCAAVTFAETGRFDGKPEYMCKLNQAYRKTVIELAGELK